MFTKRVMPNEKANNFLLNTKYYKIQSERNITMMESTSVHVQWFFFCRIKFICVQYMKNMYKTQRTYRNTIGQRWRQMEKHTKWKLFFFFFHFFYQFSCYYPAIALGHGPYKQQDDNNNNCNLAHGKKSNFS